MIAAQQLRLFAGESRVLEWEELPLPAGPQPLPSWIRGLAVQWMDGYGNSPHFLILTASNAHDWRDQRWRREGSNAWVTRHSDGRAKVHYHDGAVSLAPFVERRGWLNRKYDATLVSTLDGQPYLDRTGCWPDQPGTPRMGGGVYETVHKLATTQQEGYCGRGFSITMSAAEKNPRLRGKEVVLRGPWHSSPPRGYIEVSTVEIEKVQTTRKAPARWRRHWTQLTACFGLTLRADVLVRIFARYQPHLRLVRVHYSRGWALEPVKPEWGGAPKAVIQQVERLGNLIEKLAAASMTPTTAIRKAA